MTENQNAENRSFDAALSRLIDIGLVEKRITGYVLTNKGKRWQPMWLPIRCFATHSHTL